MSEEVKTTTTEETEETVVATEATGNTASYASLDSSILNISGTLDNILETVLSNSAFSNAITAKVEELIAELKEKVASGSNSIEDIKKSITDALSNLSAVEKAVEEYKSKIESNSTSITSLTAEVATVKAKIEELITAIDTAASNGSVTVTKTPTGILVLSIVGTVIGVAALALGIAHFFI